MPDNLVQLHVALDASFVGSAGGIGTYSWKLVQALSFFSDSLRLTLLQNRLPVTIQQYQEQDFVEQQRLPNLPGHWRRVHTSINPRIVWQLSLLPKILNKCRPNVYHALDSVSIPPWGRRIPSVVTVHDIIPLTHPQYCRRRDVWGSRLLIPMAMKRAAMVITDSVYSAEQILERYPYLASKLQVIPCGVDRVYFHPVMDKNGLAKEIAKKFALPSDRFLLTVATLSPRRNLIRLLQAFERYAEDAHDVHTCLVIAGCKGWRDSNILQYHQAMKHTRQVHFLGKVSDEDLRVLYQSAAAFVFPSLLEGFGLPVLEAMASGAPVACSGTTSVGEVAGEAAMTFDPLQEEEIADALRRILEDAELRTRLVESGFKRVENFPWKKTAEQLLKVYADVAHDV